jgi:hypothetical protein
MRLEKLRAQAWDESEAAAIRATRRPVLVFEGCFDDCSREAWLADNEGDFSAHVSEEVMALIRPIVSEVRSVKVLDSGHVCVRMITHEDADLVLTVLCEAEQRVGGRVVKVFRHDGRDLLSGAPRPPRASVEEGQRHVVDELFDYSDDDSDLEVLMEE